MANKCVFLAHVRNYWHLPCDCPRNALNSYGATTPNTTTTQMDCVRVRQRWMSVCRVPVCVSSFFFLIYSNRMKCNGICAPPSLASGCSTSQHNYSVVGAQQRKICSACVDSVYVFLISLSTRVTRFLVSLFRFECVLLLSHTHFCTRCTDFLDEVEITFELNAFAPHNIRIRSCRELNLRFLRQWYACVCLARRILNYSPRFFFSLSPSYVLVGSLALWFVFFRTRVAQWLI